jgi:minimal PKS acyl carrier protein
MDTFTIDDLRNLMRSCVGVDEGVDLDGPIEDTELADLGYDSLALAEVFSQINRRYKVSISEDAAVDLTTPGSVVRLVNETLTQVTS